MGQASGKEKQDDSVDGGALVPQGVYTGPQDYSHDGLKSFIYDRKLAPFYKGSDDEDTYKDAPENTECPICFLYYPSALNRSRCCDHPICTECFVQIKRADPTHTKPPSSEPAACPYCVEPNFGVTYRPPSVRSGLGAGHSSPTAAEGSGRAREASTVQGRRRKSFGHTDPEVITIDMIRPDWQQKLAAAQAATLRRANRRIIMRQVGNRLIPVGISSSRAGADLPEGTGPGGSIILQEGERWGNRDSSGTERRSSRRRNAEMAQYLQSINGGADMEEMMLMEAMRLSLLEHEEQQRRQAAGRGAESTGNQSSGEPVNPSAAAGAVTGSLQPPSSGPAPTHTSSAPTTSANSSSSNAANAAAPSSTDSPVGPASGSSAAPMLPPAVSQADFGLSQDMMADLSELMDNPPPNLRRSAPASPLTSPGPSSPVAPSSPAVVASTSPQMPPRRVAGHVATTSTGSSGLGRSETPPRPLNPFNPFRRANGLSQDLTRATMPDTDAPSTAGRGPDHEADGALAQKTVPHQSNLESEPSRG